MTDAEAELAQPCPRSTSRENYAHDYRTVARFNRGSLHIEFCIVCRRCGKRGWA